MFLGEHLYNVVVTSHALIMIFFLVMPIIVGGFGNWLIPIMLKIIDMLYARINCLRFWLVPGGLFLLFGRALAEDGRGTGWTIYPPLSRVEGHSGPSVDYTRLSLHVAGRGSLVGALNFVGTLYNARHYFITPDKVSLFGWAVFITTWILLLAVPVLAGAITILLADRSFNACFYDPTGLGDVVLFIHLF